VSYLLFDARVDPNIMSERGESALHVGILLKHVEIVELLLTNDKTDVNIMSTLHGTPLHLACKLDQTKIVHVLLLSGADSKLPFVSPIDGKLILPNELT
jgi:ankyrin repeat protein